MINLEVSQLDFIYFFVRFNVYSWFSYTRSYTNHSGIIRKYVPSHGSSCKRSVNISNPLFQLSLAQPSITLGINICVPQKIAKWHDFQLKYEMKEKTYVPIYLSGEQKSITNERYGDDI